MKLEHGKMYPFSTKKQEVAYDLCNPIILYKYLICKIKQVFQFCKHLNNCK